VDDLLAEFELAECFQEGLVIEDDGSISGQVRDGLFAE
jgi:hypothetical protein